MPSIALPSRSEVLSLRNWQSLQDAYKSLTFASEPFEAVEEYGVRVHELDKRLSNVQLFWRYHIAPATNRPDGTHLSERIRQIPSRMAERSYEIYCNISDAMDELFIVEEGLKPPRYRSCLNVLRFTGDALMLFDSLIDMIGVKTPSQKLSNDFSISKLFKTKLVLFPDWYHGRNWNRERDHLIAYRNMLVHHGRPWLHFTGHQQEGPPYVLDAKHCRLDSSKHEDKREFLTWAKQISMFRDRNERGKFIRLDKACEAVCDNTINWINEAYGRVVEKLDEVLSDNPKLFDVYRSQWGIPKTNPKL
jgi:hypothetical protein